MGTNHQLLRWLSTFFCQWDAIGSSPWVFARGGAATLPTDPGFMIPLGPATRVYLAPGPTDMRKSFEGLSDLVRQQFKEDPLSGHLFVFANRRRNRLKLLYWDGSGLWVCAKRLEQGCFCWPARDALSEPGALRILAEELTLLLSGIDLERTRARVWWRKAA